MPDFEVELVRVKQADGLWDTIANAVQQRAEPWLGQAADLAKRYGPQAAQLGWSIFKQKADKWTNPAISVDATPAVEEAQKALATLRTQIGDVGQQLGTQIEGMGQEGQNVLRQLAALIQQARGEISGTGEAVSDLVRQIKPDARRLGKITRRGAESLVKLLERLQGPVVQTAHGLADAAPELKKTIQDWGSTARVIKYTVPAAALGALGIWLYNSIQRNKRKRREQRMWKRLVDWVTQHQLRLEQLDRPRLKAASYAGVVSMDRTDQYWLALCKQANIVALDNEDEDEKKKKKDKLTWFEWISRGVVPGTMYTVGVPTSVGLGALAGGLLANQLDFTTTLRKQLGDSAVPPETRRAMIERFREAGFDVSDDAKVEAYLDTKVPRPSWVWGGALAGGALSAYLIYKLLKAYRNAARKRQRELE